MQESSNPALKNIFAVPNGGDRHVAVAKSMKAEGVKRGVPDLFLAVPRATNAKMAHGLFLEFKSQKGHQSKEQKGWEARLARYGYEYRIVRTADEAIEAVKEYLS